MDKALVALSTTEIQEFVTNGFVVKRNILDPELCAAARDRLWAGNTSSHLRRDAPATWINGIPEEDRQSTPDGMNDRTGSYGWRLRELSGDEDMIELLPRRVFPWFEQLLGEGEVVTPQVSSTAADPDPRGSRLRGWPVWGGKELRGLYCVLPQERTNASPVMAAAARAGAHIDPEPVHVVVSGYIDKVPQDGGGIALSPAVIACSTKQSKAQQISPIIRSCTHLIQTAAPQNSYCRGRQVSRTHSRILNPLNFLVTRETSSYGTGECFTRQPQTTAIRRRFAKWLFTTPIKNPSTTEHITVGISKGRIHRHHLR